MPQNDKASAFENFLQKDGSVSIHNRNLQVLATKMYKINRGISLSIMKGKFKPRDEGPYIICDVFLNFPHR